MKNTFIYCLYDPITGNPRYIGKSNNPRTRLRRHIKESLVDTCTYKKAWIKSLILLNLEPILDIVDEIPIHSWKFWEVHYISLYKSWGFILTNSTNGGDCPIENWGDRNPMSRPEIRAKISADRTGKPLSEYHKNQCRLGQLKRGTVPPSRLGIISYNAKTIDVNGVTYPSLSKAAIALGISLTSFRRLYHSDKVVGGLLTRRTKEFNYFETGSV